MALDLNVNQIVNEILGENTEPENVITESENIEGGSYDQEVVEESVSEMMFNNALKSAISAGFGALHTVNQIRHTRKQ